MYDDHVASCPLTQFLITMSFTEMLVVGFALCLVRVGLLCVLFV